MENNFFGGTELEHGKKVSEHGTDVLSCGDNPGGTACQRGIAENQGWGNSKCRNSVCSGKRS